MSWLKSFRFVKSLIFQVRIHHLTLFFSLSMKPYAFLPTWTWTDHNNIAKRLSQMLTQSSCLRSALITLTLIADNTLPAGVNRNRIKSSYFLRFFRCINCPENPAFYILEYTTLIGAQINRHISRLYHHFLIISPTRICHSTHCIKNYENYTPILPSYI